MHLLLSVMSHAPNLATGNHKQRLCPDSQTGSLGNDALYPRVIQISAFPQQRAAC